MKDKLVTLAIDGWSNLTNEPVLGIMIDNQLLTSIDTTGTEESMSCLPVCIYLIGHPHTGEYLATVMETAVEKATALGSTVVAIVTDNASNMTNMRSRIRDDTV